MYVIIDTGSDLSWIQCAPCKSCYPQLDNPVFDPASSPTLRNVSCDSPLCNQCVLGTDQCKYQVRYGDGSFTMGNLVSDTFTFGADGTTLPDMVFGCGLDNEGTFGGSAGLIGLGSGKLSLPSQLQQHSSLPNNRSTFSYCLPPMFSSSSTSTLTFGNAPLTTNSSKMHHTTLLRNPNPFLQNFYYVPLTGISVAGVRLPIPPTLFQINSNSGEGGVILDSGTSVTHLNPTVYAMLRKAFREAASKTGRLRSAESFANFDTCFVDDDDDGNGAPVLTSHADCHQQSKEGSARTARDHHHHKEDHHNHHMEAAACAPEAHKDHSSMAPASAPQAHHHHHHHHRRHHQHHQEAHDKEDGLPSVVFHFEGGVDLDLPTQNVLTSLDASGVDKRRCLAFVPSQEKDPFSIIGNVQQQGIRFSFDIQGATLAFATDQC